MNFQSQIDKYKIEFEAEQDPQQKAEIASLIASSYLALQRIDEAEKYYSLAHAINPLDRDIAGRYAWFYFLFKDDFDKCLSVIGDLESNQSGTGSSYGLHRLYVMKGASQLLAAQTEVGYRNLFEGYSARWASIIKEPDISCLVVVHQRIPGIVGERQWNCVIELLRHFPRINNQQFFDIQREC